MHHGVQWNPSILDTLGTALSVLIKGGGTFVHVTHLYVAGTTDGVLIRRDILISGVSL